MPPSIAQTVPPPSLQRGIDRGEFRPTAAVDLPQAIAGPAVLAALWKLLFDTHRPLDLGALCEVHGDAGVEGGQIDRNRRFRFGSRIDRVGSTTISCVAEVGNAPS